MSNELIDTFLGGQVTSNKIIVIFWGWPVMSCEIIMIFCRIFKRNNEVIVTFLSNDAHLCSSGTSPNFLHFDQVP
jgi:hypothetical protein